MAQEFRVRASFHALQKVLAFDFKEVLYETCKNIVNILIKYLLIKSPLKNQ
jgi:hypothetical protein